MKEKRKYCRLWTFVKFKRAEREWKREKDEGNWRRASHSHTGRNGRNIHMNMHMTMLEDWTVSAGSTCYYYCSSRRWSCCCCCCCRCCCCCGDCCRCLRLCCCWRLADDLEFGQSQIERVRVLHLRHFSLSLYFFFTTFCLLKATSHSRHRNRFTQTQTHTTSKKK